jgi:hypothetical protein
MKSIKRQLIVLFLLTSYFVSGQSISFQFSFTEGTSSLDQSLYIQQSGRTRRITLASVERITFNPVVASGKISQKNCDSLWSFLDNYECKHDFRKSGKWCDSILCFATELPDSLRVVINGDTIRKELLFWSGYVYEPNTKNYFKLIFINHLYIDDSKQVKIIYRNEAIYKKLQIESEMIITEQDIKLSSFLIYLLHKYDTYFDKEYLNTFISEMNGKFK